MSRGEPHRPDGPAPASEVDRLLRAIDELRDLEHERREAEASGGGYADLERRVEAKAREVFRMAETTDGDDGADGMH